MAQVTDEMAALDFDLACAFRLEIYEGEKATKMAQLIAIELSKVIAV